MPSNNVAILSLMAKFDEKSVEDAAKKLGKTTEEALSNIGQDKFGQEIVNQFNKAMEVVKKKLKGVNLSSYTGNVLDSLFSDKDIADKTKDLQKFIDNISNLSKSLSGLSSNALNSMTTKQLDAVIAKQEKITSKSEGIAKKAKELEGTAKNIAGKKRNISTISNAYGQTDYEKLYESLKKILTTDKEFDTTQQKSIKHLAEMLALYTDMENVQPQKGTTEAIKYGTDLLTVVKEIKKTSDSIDLFTNGKASTFVNDNFDSTKKVNQYGSLAAQQDYVKAGLSGLNAQKAKLEKDLTEYIGSTVQKNLEKNTKNAERTIDKTTQKVEKLQEKIDTLKGDSSDKPILKNIVDESNVKTLEEIEDRLYAIYDKDADGEATNKELKEYISLYKEYEKLIASDTTGKFDPDLKDEYNMILDTDEAMKKYAASLDDVSQKKKELNAISENEKTSDTKLADNTRVEQLEKQESNVKETIQAEEKLSEVQKENSNTSITVDAEKAIESINNVKEGLESIPDEKNIKISVNDTDYSSIPLLSNEEGKVVDAFRGVTGAWSGLINQDGISFFTDKMKLAADYADSMAQSGKVYKANLSFINPLEIDGNGAKRNEIDFNGVKKTTDEIVEIARQLGHDGIIFKNIRDGFADTEDDISNVMVALDRAQIKNEQVVASVKAGTGKMTSLLSETNISSPSQTFDNEMQQNLVMLENYKNTVKEIDALKLEPETDDTKRKIEELNKLADYFVSQITVIRGENGYDVSPSMMKFSGQWSEQLKKYPNNKIDELYQLASDKSGLQIGSIVKEFSGIESEIVNIESKSETLRASLTQTMQDSTAYAKELKYSLITIAASEEELKTEENPKWIERFNKDIDNAIAKFPELEEFKNKFSSEKQALDFVKSDSWNDFLSTLPQAQKYLESIGYDFEKINSNSTKDVIQAESETTGIKDIEKAADEAVQAKKEFAAANEGVQSSIDDSKSPLQLEADLMDQIAKSAREAADAKKEFVEANKQVQDGATGSKPKSDKYAKRSKVSDEDFLNKHDYYASIANDQLKSNGSTVLGGTVNTELVNGLVKVTAKIKDADGVWKSFSAKIDGDSNMFEQRFKTITKGVNKLDAELSNFGKDKVTTPLTDEQVQKFKELNNYIDKYSIIQKRIAKGNAFSNDEEDAKNLLETINKIMGKVDGSVTILSNKQLSDAQDKLNKINQTISDISQESISNRLNKLSTYDKKVSGYDATLAKFQDGGWTSPEYLKNVKAVGTALEKYKSALNELKDNPELVNKKALDNLDKLELELKQATTAVSNMSAAQKGFSFVSGQKELDKIRQILKDNSAMSNEAKAEIKAYYKEIESGNPSASLDVIHGKIMKIVNAEAEAGRSGKRFFDVIKEKAWYGMASQIGMYFGFNDIIRYGGEVIKTVRKLDTAYTEMRKVSDETKQSLKNFQKESFSTADTVGTTALALQDATATWMRLGESLDEAKESAKDATVLLNVSEFENIDEATDSLVAMSQAYKELDKMEIIDILDKIGNEYSISTDQLSTALKDSAAVLKTQGNDLAESVALITAGKVITCIYRNIYNRMNLIAGNA